MKVESLSLPLRSISARDLEQLQKRAVAEGMPYQTLIASTLHKFVTGQLKETKPSP